MHLHSRTQQNAECVNEVLVRFCLKVPIQEDYF